MKEKETLINLELYFQTEKKKKKGILKTKVNNVNYTGIDIKRKKR